MSDLQARFEAAAAEPKQLPERPEPAPAPAPTRKGARK